MTLARFLNGSPAYTGSRLSEPDHIVCFTTNPIYRAKLKRQMIPFQDISDDFMKNSSSSRLSCRNFILQSYLATWLRASLAMLLFLAMDSRT